MKYVIGFAAPVLPIAPLIFVEQDSSREYRRPSKRLNLILNKLTGLIPEWLFARAHVYPFKPGDPERYFILYNAERSSNCIKIKEIEEDEFYSDYFDPRAYFPEVPELLFPTR